MRRTIVSAAVATAVASVVAAGIVNVDATHDRERAERTARTEACERRQAIVDGFDAFTDALIAAGEDEDRTPEEEAERQERIDAFRADLAARLKPLLPTDC